MRLTISHETAYHYEDQVRTSIQYLRLTPPNNERQQVLQWQLDLPRPAQARRDPFGNILHVLSLEEPHADLLISARGEVEIDPTLSLIHISEPTRPY